MLAPVVIAFYRGREWCGLYCPRGSLWDHVLAKINSRTNIPCWAKTKSFRFFMVILIFTVFGWQMANAWPDSREIGLVFLRIIFLTTVAGVVLALAYSPRTWCNICPMGTLAALLSSGRRPIMISSGCIKCGLCAKVCPMELSPYESELAFSHSDCLKCGKCINSCPKKVLRF